MKPDTAAPSIAIHVRDPGHPLLDGEALAMSGVSARAVTLDEALAWERLPRDAALVIVEMTAPALDLLKKLVRLRQSGATWTPLIACCERSDDIRAALNAGADDFILNYDLVTVEARLSVVVRQKLRNDKLDEILDCTFDGIVTIDGAGTLLTFNRAAQDMFGFSFDEVVGRNVSLLMDDDQARSHDRHLRRYAETGERHIIGTGRELIGRTKSGQTFPLFLQVANLRSGKEQIFVGILKDLSVDAQAKALKHESRHDALTGISNRNAVESILPHWIARHSDLRASPFAVLFIDLNGFKAINDTHGHDAGDAVLKAIGGRLAHNVAAGDVVARMSGDEFVVLLEGIGAHADAQVIARRLADRIAVPIGYEESSLSVGAAIGIAIFPEDGITVAELLRRADSAMYEHKRQGATERSARPDPATE